MGDDKKGPGVLPIPPEGSVSENDAHDWGTGAKFKEKERRQKLTANEFEARAALAKRRIDDACLDAAAIGLCPAAMLESHINDALREQRNRIAVPDDPVGAAISEAVARAKMDVAKRAAAAALAPSSQPPVPVTSATPGSPPSTTYPPTARPMPFKPKVDEPRDLGAATRDKRIKEAEAIAAAIAADKAAAEAAAVAEHKRLSSGRNRPWLWFRVEPTHWVPLPDHHEFQTTAYRDTLSGLVRATPRGYWINQWGDIWEGDEHPPDDAVCRSWVLNPPDAPDAQQRRFHPVMLGHAPHNGWPAADFEGEAWSHPKPEGEKIVTVTAAPLIVTEEKLALAGWRDPVQGCFDRAIDKAMAQGKITLDTTELRADTKLIGSLQSYKGKP